LDALFFRLVVACGKPSNPRPAPGAGCCPGTAGETLSRGSTLLSPIQVPLFSAAASIGLLVRESMRSARPLAGSTMAAPVAISGASAGVIQGADPARMPSVARNRGWREPWVDDGRTPAPHPHLSLGCRLRAARGHQAQRTNSAMAQSNRAGNTQPGRALERQIGRRAPQAQRSGPTARPARWAVRAAVVETGWKRWKQAHGAVKLSPPECRQLRKASAAPVPLLPQPLAFASPATGPADPCLHHRGSGARALSRPPALQRRPLPTPATTPRTNMVRSFAAGSDPQRRRRASPALRLWRQGRTHPQRLCWWSAWGSDLWRNHLVLKNSTLRPPRDLGQDGEPNSFCGQLLRRSVAGHRPDCALCARSPGNPARRSAACSNASRPIPAALAAAVEAGPPARDALLRETLHLAVGARAGGSGRQDRRGLPSPGLPTSAHGPQPAGGALAELGDGAGALACLGTARR